jgi:hypothetical protein
VLPRKFTGMVPVNTTRSAGAPVSNAERSYQHGVLASFARRTVDICLGSKARIAGEDMGKV